VAGAWVGFNDARVTMRSNYWGQGGHNAVLVVGDFFRSALSARLIDARATFPGGKLPPVQAAPVPAAPAEPPPEDWMDQLRALQPEQSQQAAPEPMSNGQQETDGAGRPFIDEPAQEMLPDSLPNSQ